jgi:RNA polymerase primary sigma factor
LWHKEDSSTIKDLIEDTYSVTPVENAMNNVVKEDLNNALAELEKRTADVIRCRYGLEDSYAMTLEEVSARYNLTRERIRQIEKRALVQIQKSSCGEKLRSYIA